MKVTVKQLEERYNKLHDIASKFAKDIRSLKTIRPYHYTTQTVGPDKTKTMNVVPVAELYAHVQTANNLGYETKIEAVDGRLQIVFVEKLPTTPWEIL